MKKGKLIVSCLILAGIYSTLHPSESSTSTSNYQTHSSGERTASQLPTTQTIATPSSTQTSTVQGSYEEIYDTYAQRLRQEGQRCIQAFDEEKVSHESDLEFLAEAAGKYVNQLAEIEAEGTEEMAEFMYRSASSYDGYEEWAAKLYIVYEEESTKIMDDYVNSFTLGY